MTMLVLDSSIAMSWCFADQGTDYGRSVLEALADGCAVVPELWLLEVANVVGLAEQRGILAAADRIRFLDLLGGLRKQVDVADEGRAWGQVYDLALKHGLTSYDARYLELAARMDLPIATADRELKAAAKRERVHLFRA